MADLPPIGADLTLDMDNWDRNMRRALRSAADFDSAVANAQDAVNSLERTINSVDSLIDLQVDDSEIHTAQTMIAGLDGEDATVTIHASMEDMDTALRTLSDIDSEGVNVAIDTDDADLDTALDKIGDIDSSAPTVTVDTNDAEVDATKRKTDSLGGTVSKTVRIIGGDQIDDISQKITDIRNMSAITLTMNVAGTAVDFMQSVADFAVGGLLEMDTALAQIQGRTGQMIPEAEHLITDLYSRGIGESRSQIAEMVILASQLGVANGDMGEALESAFQTAVNTGQDVTEVLQTQNALVTSGLSESFTAAGDTLTAAFQNGVNRAGDALEAFREYSTDFADLGFTGDQMATTLIEGLRANMLNSDMAGDAIREMQTRILNDFENEDFQAALETLGQVDEAEAFRNGELAGTEFLNGLTTALGQVENFAETQSLAATLFGTQAEDFNAEAIQALNPLAAATEDTTGQMSESFEVMTSDLSSQVEELSRFIETEFQEAFDNAFDISAMIDRAKEAIGSFFDTLESGGSVGEALGIAIDVLNIPILEDFQQTLSSLAIGMLEAAQGVLGAMGRDTSGISGAITELGTAQFEIDINTAETAAEIEDAVGTALERGIAVNDAYATLVDQMGGAVERGNFELAAAIRDNVQNAGEETAALLQIYEDVQNYVPAFREGEFESRAAQMGIDAEEAYARINELDDAMAELDIDPEFFTIVGQHAGEAFSAGYTAQLQALVEGGQLGEALSAANFAGDTEAIGGLASQISETWFTAIEEQNTAAIAEMQDDAAILLGVLEEQFAIHPTDTGLQEWIAELHTSITELEGVELPEIPTEETDQSADSLENLSTSMVEFSDTAGERTTMVNENLQAMADKANEISEAMQEDLQAVKEEFTPVATTAENELPRVSTAMDTLKTNIQTNEAAITQSLLNIQTQIQATVGAIGTLPSNAGGTATPITLPAPTQSGTGSTGWAIPPSTPGTTTPPSGTAPQIPSAGGVGHDALPFLPGGGVGGSSIDNSVKTVNINNVFYPQSQAVGVASGYAVAQMAKGF